VSSRPQSERALTSDKSTMVVRLHELRVHGGRVRRIRRRRRDILRRIRELKEFRHVPLPESVEREEEREPAHRFSRFIPSPCAKTYFACSLFSFHKPFSFASLFPTIIPLSFLFSFSALTRRFFSFSSFRRLLSRGGLSRRICRPFTRDA
jgi:hypothetical protein